MEQSKPGRLSPRIALLKAAMAVEDRHSLTSALRFFWVRLTSIERNQFVELEHRKVCIKESTVTKKTFFTSAAFCAESTPPKKQTNTKAQGARLPGGSPGGPAVGPRVGGRGRLAAEGGHGGVPPALRGADLRRLGWRSGAVGCRAKREGAELLGFLGRSFGI